MALLAVLCLVAYGPSLRIPLIADDYPNLAQAQLYGSLSGLLALLHDALFRLRAASYWAMFLLWQAFHLRPLAYHATSLLLHIANTWLVYSVARTWPRMRPAGLWAAAYFAVQEGHQEAIMWFSAINELLMFFFGLGSLLCWMLAGSRERSRFPQLAGVVLFGLALLSKESAIILLPLFWLAAPPEGNWRRSMTRMLPYVALSALAIASIAATRTYSFRFSDGSFSLDAPFWISWTRGFARILWIWGWASGAAIVLVSKEPNLGRAALRTLAWIGIALVPYSFLTYSTQIPSRQTYLASAGLCFLFGLAVAGLPARWANHQKIVSAVVVLMLIHNIGYLWIRKRAQFIERAEPTEQLIRLARETAGPIWVRCFPTPALVA